MASGGSWVVSLVTLLGYVGVALYMIVNPDVVGQARGWVGRGGYVDAPTPGCMVRFAGCVMLAVFPGVAVGSAMVWWAGVLVGIAIAVGLYLLAVRLIGE